MCCNNSRHNHQHTPDTGRHAKMADFRLRQVWMGPKCKAVIYRKLALELVLYICIVQLFQSCTMVPWHTFFTLKKGKLCPTFFGPFAPLRCIKTRSIPWCFVAPFIVNWSSVHYTVIKCSSALFSCMLLGISTHSFLFTSFNALQRNVWQEHTAFCCEWALQGYWNWLPFTLQAIMFFNSFPPTIGIYAASQWVGLNLTIKSCAESALPAQLTAANGKLPISTCDRELSNYVTDVMANHGGHVIRNHALESETPAPRG